MDEDRNSDDLPDKLPESVYQKAELAAFKVRQYIDAVRREAGFAKPTGPYAGIITDDDELPDD